jgi:hypothetical protein
LANCPSCHSKIDIGSEFFGGLFTCPSCRAVYFIGFDGTPESAAPPPVPASFQPPSENSQSASAIEVPTGLPSLPDEADSPHDYGNQNFSTPVQNQPADFSASAGEQANPYNLNAPTGFEPAQQNQAQDYSNMGSTEPAVSYQEPAPFAPLQDVVEFANQEGTSSLVEYSVEIRGLDLASNVQAMKDLFTDSKLGLRWEDLKPKLKNGVLKLEKLNPAQAAVIAFRLRPIPVEMQWEQSLT